MMNGAKQGFKECSDTGGLLYDLSLEGEEINGLAMVVRLKWIVVAVVYWVGCHC